jgi:ankyrin repeat protein
MRGSNRGITRNNTPLRSNKKVQDEFEDDPNTSERNSNKKSIHDDDDDDDDDGNKNNDDDDDNSNVEECDYDYDYDQENIEDHQQEDIEILVQTVNNLTRMHEALAFLNDSNRNLRDKQISVRRQNRHGVTALFWAIRRGADHCLVEKMVEIGGKELVLLTNKYKENVLHNAAFCGSRYDVYKTILDAGEKDVLLQRDRLGNTPMHYSCAWGVSIRAIEYMAEIGGRDALMVKNNEGQVPHSKNTKLQEYLSEIGGLEYQIELLEQKQNAELSFFDLLMLNKTERAEIRLDDKNERKKLFDQDENGLNSLMVAIWFVGNSSPVFHSRLSSLIRKMIKKGGKELVLATNTTNSTVLHYAAFNGAPFDIIKLLVETAGQDILQKQNDWGSTPLHDSCYRHAPVEVIEYLVQQGGIGALKATNKDGITPLEILFHADIISDIHITTLQCAWYDLDPHCSRACHRKIVQKTLKWADNLDPKSLRNNNFVKALLNDRFIMNRYQMIVFADLYAQLGIVLSLSPGLITVVYGDQRSNNQSYEEIRNTFLSIMLPTLGICVSWFIGRELVQIFASPFDNYSKGYNNFIDIAQLILVCVSIHIFVEVRNGGEEELNSGATGVVICSAAVAWTQLLFAIGQLSYSVSLFTYALVQVSRYNIFYKGSSSKLFWSLFHFLTKKQTLFFIHSLDYFRTRTFCIDCSDCHCRFCSNVLHWG